MRSYTLKEQIRRNWIQELQKQGMTQGPNGEQLQSMKYSDLLSLKIRQEVRDERESEAYATGHV